MNDFEELYQNLSVNLLNAYKVDVGEWHAQDVSDNPMLVTRELRNVVIDMPVPHTIKSWQNLIKPNLPFAEAQFEDRVSGKPLNPPPSAALWPYKQKGHEDHLKGGKFSHTYPERFWPKHAGERGDGIDGLENNYGIRYDLGDLNDVVEMLGKSPFTRQAYLPVWFPEDTGNHGVRLPCSLGYHFMLRDSKLYMTYFIRSVDFVRHFRDDVYMAGRLLQWMLMQLKPKLDRLGDEHWSDSEHVWNLIAPGKLVMHMISLHCMEGDRYAMEKELSSGTQ